MDAPLQRVADIPRIFKVHLKSFLAIVIPGGRKFLFNPVQGEKRAAHLALKLLYVNLILN